MTVVLLLPALVLVLVLVLLLARCVSLADDNVAAAADERCAAALLLFLLKLLLLLLLLRGETAQRLFSSRGSGLLVSASVSLLPQQFLLSKCGARGGECLRAYAAECLRGEERPAARERLRGRPRERARAHQKWRAAAVGRGTLRQVSVVGRRRISWLEERVAELRYEARARYTHALQRRSRACCR